MDSSRQLPKIPGPGAGYALQPEIPAKTGKNRARGWLIACASCVVVVAVLIGVGAYLLVKLVQDDLPDVRRAAMHSGERLGWRELPYHPENIITIRTYMWDIDADGDGDRELLFLDENDAELTVVEVDGTIVSRHYWEWEPTAEHLLTWDYDGDGAEELVYPWSSEDKEEHEVQVLDFEGDAIDWYEDMTLPLGSASGDVDGDGLEELLLVYHDGSSLELISQYGELLLEADNTFGREKGKSLDDPFLADLDGDGLYSVVYGTGYTKRVQGLEGGYRELLIPQDARLAERQAFVRSIDLDGDGSTELLDMQGRLYFDPDVNELREIANPLSENVLRPLRRRDQLEMFDIDSDGEPEMVCVPGGRFGAELLGFGADGTLDYHESMAKYCGGIAVVDRDGVQYIAVCAFERVWIYP
ncbi:hypothetical protein KDL44_06995 [bacterium]|nr:hypothetical protein [bacterium]